MRSAIIPVPELLVSYVKNIFIFENALTDTNTVLPFFADGFPGIIFQVAANGVYLNPNNKRLSDFFLYGQTIHPIELSIEGSYKIIVYQLYPFVAKSLFKVNPKELNDECFDLCLVPGFNVSQIIEQLKNASSLPVQVEIISSFLLSIIQTNKNSIDTKIQLAIHLILNSSGKISIKELRRKLHITERTFERQFIAQTGVSPKQFVRIIQFQFSLNQLSGEEYSRLTDVVFDNGFADQSHFIRTFKKFTGTTPVNFKKQHLS